MSLQVRLRHPLGDRLIELSPRPAQQPVVVGRMAGAEVQVPSVAVAPRHSIFFVHQGRWVVQDAAGAHGAGTFVNGRRIAAATFLKVGDVVALGGDPKSPTIEIDPEGPAEGRTGHAMAQPGAASAAPRAAGLPPQAARPPAGFPASAAVPGGYLQTAPPPQPRAAYGHPAPPQPGYLAQPGYGQAAPVAAPASEWGGEQQEPDGDSIAWDTEAESGPARPIYARRKKKQDNTPMILAAIVVGAAVVGGLIFFVYRSKQAAVVPPPARKAATKAVAPAKPPKSGGMFDDLSVTPPRGGSSSGGGGAGSAAERVTANATEVTATAGIGRKAASGVKDANTRAGLSNTGGAPARSSPAEAAAEVLAAKTDERMKTPEWRNITTAYYARNPLDALLRIDDYERTRPGVLSAELAKLRDGVMDRLWFERIDQLWTKREGLAMQLADVELALSEETNESYKKSTILPEKQALQRKMDSLNDILQKEMGYTADQPPLLTDESDLARLRQYRDDEYYAKWKQNILTTVHRRRTLPFEWGR
jgi:hypothetical protein